MAKARKNAECEHRITEEIIVDAHGPEEQVLGWYYYLEERLRFPFSAKCVTMMTRRLACRRLARESLAL